MAGRAQPHRDEEAVRRFVEHVAMTMDEWGFPRMAGRVLMTLMSAEEPALSAAELSDRLGVSPAAISGAVRYLVHTGLIMREPVPGSRRDRYRLPDNAWYESSVAKMRMIKMLAELADEGVEATGGSHTAAGARVADMRDFFNFTVTELDQLMIRWHQTKAIRSS